MKMKYTYIHTHTHTHTHIYMQFGNKKPFKFATKIRIQMKEQNAHDIEISIHGKK